MCISTKLVTCIYIPISKTVSGDGVGRRCREFLDFNVHSITSYILYFTLPQDNFLFLVIFNTIHAINKMFHCTHFNVSLHTNQGLCILWMRSPLHCFRMAGIMVLNWYLTFAKLEIFSIWGWSSKSNCPQLYWGYHSGILILIHYILVMLVTLFGTLFQ